MKKVLLILSFLTLSLIPLSLAVTGEAEIFEAAQVFQAGIDSKIAYEINLKEADFVKPPEVVRLSGYIQQVTSKTGAVSYGVGKLEGAGNAAFERGEKAFFDKDYEAAIGYYQETRKLAPSFLPIYNFIGDAYYMMKDFKNAVNYFTKETEVNYCNYQGHWFLADALWAMKEQKQAAHEITVAHVLNRNHPELKKVMVYYRDSVGQPWKDWTYIPQCEITKKDKDTVTITVTKDWLGYGMDKALWRFEPGYAAKHNAGTDKGTLYYIEEAEALIAKTGKSDKDPVLKRIADDNNFLVFMLYEITSLTDPGRLAASPPEMVEKVVGYLDRYH